LKLGLIKEVLLCVFIFGLTPNQVSAQGSVTFEASVSTRQVALDNYVEVVFSLKNGVGTDFKAPDFAGFEVVSGPSKSVSTTVINSVVTRAFGYTYLLRPLRKGPHTIKAASIKVNNQVYKTNPLAISVLAKATVPQAKAKIKPEVILMAEVLSPEMYIGQQGVITYFLYTNVPVQDIRLEKESDYTGFFAKNRNVQFASSETVLMGNKEYYKYAVKKVSLFAQVEGVKEIEPMELTVLVSLPDTQTNFWGIEDTEQVTAKSNMINIRVRPIPQSDVEAFSGAVGYYQTNASLSTNVLKSGKPAVLRVTVTGDGDPNRLFPSFLSSSDSFEIFEPRTSEELFVEGAELLSSSKTIEYTIVPKLSGKFVIQPKLFVFDPNQQVFGYTTGNELNLLVEDFKALPLKGNTLDNYRWSKYLFLLLLPVVALFGFYNIVKRKKPLVSADKIKLLQDLDDPYLDYVQLSALLQDYLCRTFQISTTEFVSKNIAKILIDRGLDPVVANNWQNVVMHLQANTYAPVSDSNIQSDIHQIKQLL
jgi:BatD DUF11 like domain